MLCLALYLQHSRIKKNGSQEPGRLLFLYFNLMKYNILLNEELLRFDVVKAAALYKAVFIGVFDYSGYNVGVFYQSDPLPSHSTYFGLYVSDGRLMICNADFVLGVALTGVLCPDRVVMYSVHRHHYKSYGEWFVDGGGEYVRTNCKELVCLRVNKEKLDVCESS